MSDKEVLLTKEQYLEELKKLEESRNALDRNQFERNTETNNTDDFGEYSAPSHRIQNEIYEQLRYLQSARVVAAELSAADVIQIGDVVTIIRWRIEDNGEEVLLGDYTYELGTKNTNFQRSTLNGPLGQVRGKKVGDVFNYSVDNHGYITNYKALIERKAPSVDFMAEVSMGQK